MNRRIVAALGWAIFYFGPVTLLIFRVIPFFFRFDLLVIQAVLAGGFACFRYDLKMLGLRADNLKRALAINGLLCLLFLIPLCFAPSLRLANRFYSPQAGFYLFYIFVSCPCQEFLYRSIPFAELKLLGLRGHSVRIAAMSLPYAYMHLIYHDAITFFIALFIGIVWALVYERLPNFFGVTLSHIVLGMVTIFMGII
jgi:hypothetical protein